MTQQFTKSGLYPLVWQSHRVSRLCKRYCGRTKTLCNTIILRFPYNACMNSGSSGSLRAYAFLGIALDWQLVQGLRLFMKKRSTSLRERWLTTSPNLYLLSLYGSLHSSNSPNPPNSRGFFRVTVFLGCQFCRVQFPRDVIFQRSDPLDFPSCNQTPVVVVKPGKPRGRPREMQSATSAFTVLCSSRNKVGRRYHRR